MRMRLRGAIVLPLRVYRAMISPMIPRSCRYVPSCSAYAIEAIIDHGAVAGGGLAVRRLWRCQPRFPGGYDPVPRAER